MPSLVPPLVVVIAGQLSFVQSTCEPSALAQAVQARRAGFALDTPFWWRSIVIGRSGLHNEFGRLAVDVSLANRVRSGRKQP